MRPGIIVPLIAILLLVACGGEPAPESELEGRVLLWHTWSGSDEQALNELLDKFNDVYPEVTVISISYSDEELREQFVDVAQRGMGPDVIIGSQLWIPELVDAGLIHAVEEERIESLSLPFYCTPIFALSRPALWPTPLGADIRPLLQ